MNETHPFFHPHAKYGKVYLVNNKPEHCGLDECIKRFQEEYEHTQKQKNSARTCNDGLRPACILLDPQHRDAVAGVMSKKKDRKKADVPGDPTTHFFEKTLDDCFANSEYVVHPPQMQCMEAIDPEDKSVWQPNHTTTFEHQRSGSWLRGTWEDYVRPKYKKALDKWNKETGGGDGTPTSFIDYCGGDRWLVCVFLKDMEANFLLADNAGGRMPKHLQAESGFEDVSELTTKLEDEVTQAKRQRQKIDATLDKVASLIEKRDAVMEKRDGNATDACIDKVANYLAKINDRKVLASMSPDSRDIYVSTVKKRRKELL